MPKAPPARNRLKQAKKLDSWPDFILRSFDSKPQRSTSEAKNSLGPASARSEQNRYIHAVHRCASVSRATCPQHPPLVLVPAIRLEISRSTLRAASSFSVQLLAMAVSSSSE